MEKLLIFLICDMVFLDILNKTGVIQNGRKQY